MYGVHSSSLPHHLQIWSYYITQETMGSVITWVINYALVCVCVCVCV